MSRMRQFVVSVGKVHARIDGDQFLEQPFSWPEKNFQQQMVSGGVQHRWCAVLEGCGKMKKNPLRKDRERGFGGAMMDWL